jgi:hypothetical protein
VAGVAVSDYDRVLEENRKLRAEQIAARGVIAELTVYLLRETSALPVEKADTAALGRLIGALRTYMAVITEG